jgi:hypothetical protein
MVRTEQHNRDGCCVCLYWAPERRGYRYGRKNIPRRFLLLTRKRKESCGSVIKTCERCLNAYTASTVADWSLWGASAAKYIVWAIWAGRYS